MTMTSVVSAQILPAMPVAFPAGPTQRILPRAGSSARGAVRMPRIACWNTTLLSSDCAHRQARRRVLQCRAEKSEGSDFDLSQWVEGKVSEGTSRRFHDAEIARPEHMSQSARTC